MDKSANELASAKIKYFFKETFRAHSMAEYREIFSRGLNENNDGITGAFPWLYVRAFFALFILFTINTLVLRLTNNALYVPSVTFLGGITFTVPFLVLLFELYPKRDISLFVLIAILVGGGTASIVLTQIGLLIKVNNGWLSAILAGILEESAKAVVAIIAIIIFKQKNPYACFLLAAAVGAGFSVIEDMGYIFCYSDRYVFYYHSDIQATVALFVNRGLSSFCTHVLWTGAIGWSYALTSRRYRSVRSAVLFLSIALHTCWDFPLEGIWQFLDIAACVIIAAALNITIVHKARINTLSKEMDLTHANEIIIREAKKMGERLRFTNAANLTFALTCTLLSVIVLLLCSLPIGMEYQSEEYDSKEDFIAYIEGGYNLKYDFDRKYVEKEDGGINVEERYSLQDDSSELELVYVVQKEVYAGFDGEYYYHYYLDDKDNPFDVKVELPVNGVSIMIPSTEYNLDGYVSVFGVNDSSLIDYNLNSDGTVTAVTAAEEFSGYNLLIALCATGCAIAAGSMVILVAFRIKLHRLKGE